MSEQVNYIQDEISLLERAIADAKEEFDRGELDAESFERLCLRDQASIERLRGQIAQATELGSSEIIAARDEARAGRLLSRGIVVLIVATVVTISGVVLWMVLGTQSSPPSQRDAIVTMLNRADTEVQRAKPAEALVLYNEVLKLDPKQSQALAQSGWLTFEAGMLANSKPLVAHGERLVREATKVDPTLYAAHLYLGVIDLMARHNPKAALTEFTTFRALHPPAKWQSLADQYTAQAKKQLGR